jgi:hypothetical protein
MSKLSANVSVSFMGKFLQPVDFAKDLGILLDNYHLSYDRHVSKLVSPCFHKLCQVSNKQSEK